MLIYLYTHLKKRKSKEKKARTEIRIKLLFILNIQNIHTNTSINMQTACCGQKYVDNLVLGQNVLLSN